METTGPVSSAPETRIAAARKRRDRGARQDGGDQARPDRPRLRRPCPPRGRARNGQDRARTRDRRERRGRRVPADPVHAGSPADGRHGALRLQPTRPRLRVPAGAGVRERPPRRRDQPRDAEDAVRAPRGHGRAAGDDRRRHARAARAVPRARDREPDRAGGDVPTAGGAARPLLPAHGARVSLRGRRGRDRRAAAERPSAPRAASGAHARRGACAAWRRRGGLHRSRSSAGGSSSSCVRRAQPRASRSARPSAGASRSSVRRAHGRSSVAATT